MSWLEAALRWYAILLAVTWAFAPGVRWLCIKLFDSGASLARPLALLAAVYPAWLLTSLGLTPFGNGLLVITVALAAGLGWTLTIRGGQSLGRWLRGLLVAEAASAALFATYVWLRGYTPEILGTEKPMDVAFLASSMRSAGMPPPDPWFAGDPINYYYLGYLLHGTVGRLGAVPPEVAFNLALATIFSTTLVAAFGLGWNVVAPMFGRRLALAGAAFAAYSLAIAGNLYAPLRLIQDAPATLSAWWWDSAAGIGWRSSRIVCDGPRVGNLCQFPAVETINEFPFFSMLLGDLHPHLMALPYALVAIGLTWNLWQMSDAPGGTAARWIRLALSGAAAGALYPLNAWDFPTFLLLTAVGVWIAFGPSPRTVALHAIALMAAAVVPWLPFLARYVPPTTSTGDGMAALPGVSSVLSAFALHLGERTSLREYLTIFGAPYLFGVALVLFVWRNEAAPNGPLQAGPLAVITAATIVPGIVLSAPVIPLCGIPLALSLVAIKRILRPTPQTFSLVLFAFAWALSIGVEIIYVRDAFDDRMNTLFKFYYQAWTLYAIAGAIALPVLWRGSRLAWQRAALTTAAAASILAGAAYPVVATHQWTKGFAMWHGLDGLAYGEASSPDDVAAIRWLGERAKPGDVVLEAAGCSYYPFGRLPFNRVSAFTGIPTVIGWANHERQWRAGQPDRLAAIERRQEDVASIYADPSSAAGDAYAVDWLFVGEYETGGWQAECETAGPYEGIASPTFPGPEWEEAFQSGQTRIFRRAAG